MFGIPPFIFIYLFIYFALPSLKGKSSTFKWITKIKKKKAIGFKVHFFRGSKTMFYFQQWYPLLTEQTFS